MSDYLPTEVVTEILSRIPVKSLMRMKCVCKSWLALITEPDFIKIHFLQTKTNKVSGNQLLIRYLNRDSLHEQYSIRRDDDDFSEVSEFRCSLTSIGIHYRVVGVCNGVIFLSDDLFGSNYTYILWNPSVKRYVRLPKPSFASNKFGAFFTVLGFGCNANKDDYKVVRLAYVEEKVPPVFAEVPMVEIYSLQMGTWRELKHGMPKCSFTEHVWSQTFLHGKVHWAAYQGKMPNHSNVVLSFDIDDESFGIFQFPPALTSILPLDYKIESLRNKLTIISADSTIDGCCFDVYVMDEYGEARSWSRVIRVQSYKVIRTILGFTPSGKWIIHSQDNEIETFDPESMKRSCTDITSFTGSAFVAAYEESMFLSNEGFLAIDDDVGAVRRRVPCHCGGKSLSFYCVCYYFCTRFS